MDIPGTRKSKQIPQKGFKTAESEKTGKYI